MRIHPPFRRVGPLEFRENILEVPGDAVPPHVHQTDHVSYVIRGRVHIRLEKDGKVVEREGGPGEPFLIPAGVHHSFTALEADTRVDCLFVIADLVGEDDGDTC